MDYLEYDRLVYLNYNLNINILIHLQDVNITISFIDRSFITFFIYAFTRFLPTSFKVFYIFCISDSY